MRLRQQLPVHSPVRLLSLVRAAGGALRRDDGDLAAVTAALQARYAARSVVLTDSGTSALVMALRLATGEREGGTVAFPGYACIDLAAAALRARVRVRLYDLDPATLSPDLGSVERAIARGVDAVLVAHLYGFPADVAGVASLAEQAGVRVIEDAAQGVGGSLAGKRLGAFGPLSVVSFGRGKGMSGGGGGALMATTEECAAQLEAARPTVEAGGAGWHALEVAGAQWLLGRPQLYGIPASIPALRLGEMVYHPAHEPSAMPRAAAVLVRSALEMADAESAVRQRHAAQLETWLAGANDLRGVASVPGGHSGYLRFPVVDMGEGGRRTHAPELGVLRGYPLALSDQKELQPCLHAGEGAPPGAALLARSLYTLPTHSQLGRRDLRRLRGWIERGEAV
ncbi:MAG TPA: DegT/DnrJ/EryC1/StrS family aminotransferase [Gemmatimonadaceae bacterium]|nr:DegT/DnrJ/EryC1/StrS family aminotransferase [Gemmatimonadaceae bacterium]